MAPLLLLFSHGQASVERGFSNSGGAKVERHRTLAQHVLYETMSLERLLNVINLFK